jgi:hypothetical protein
MSFRLFQTQFFVSSNAVRSCFWLPWLKTAGNVYVCHWSSIFWKAVRQSPQQTSRYKEPSECIIDGCHAAWSQCMTVKRSRHSLQEKVVDGYEIWKSQTCKNQNHSSHAIWGCKTAPRGRLQTPFSLGPGWEIVTLSVTTTHTMFTLFICTCSCISRSH